MAVTDLALRSLFPKQLILQAATFIVLAMWAVIQPVVAQEMAGEVLVVQFYSNVKPLL
jgi:hypothetical protein